MWAVEIVSIAGLVVVISFLIMAFVLRRDRPRIRSMRLGVFFERETYDDDKEEP